MAPVTVVIGGFTSEAGATGLAPLPMTLMLLRLAVMSPPVSARITMP